MTGARRATLGRMVDVAEVGSIPRRNAADATDEHRGGDDLDRAQTVTFVTMWIVVIFVASALEPPPANPHAAPVLGALLTTLFLAGMGTTAILALTKSRFRTAVASLCTGAVAVAMTITCPAVGHHHLGAWWFGQLALVMAPIAWSFGQFRLSRPREL